MKTINHYPGGDPVKRRPLNVDAVVGTIALALMCAGLLIVWRT